MPRYGRDCEWYLGSERLHGQRLNLQPCVNSFIEIWNYPSGHTTILEGKLTPSPLDIDEWLGREAPVDENQDKPAGGLRLILSPIEFKIGWRHSFAFDEQTLVHVMSKLNLPSSYLQGLYLENGCYSRHTFLELAGSAPDSCVGFTIESPVSAPHDHDFTFTWDLKTKVAQGILRTTSQERLNFLLKSIRSLQTLANPLLLAFVVLEFIDLETYDGSSLVSNSIARVQKETGHLGGMYTALDGANTEHKAPDYGSLTVQLSEIGQLVSWYKTRAKSAVHLGDFLLESIDYLEKFESSCSSGARTRGEAELFQKDMKILRDLVQAAATKMDHHVDLLDHYQQLCLIQNQTVYNLIGQRDVQQNLELAKDSKSIAAASKRDSSAMKSIALLTMIILPGTFISTLFAVPLFNWDAESWSGVAKDRFWFYWAITLPLTILTLVIWIVWQRAWDAEGVKLDKEARDRVGRKEGGSQDVNASVEGTSLSTGTDNPPLRTSTTQVRDVEQGVAGGAENPMVPSKEQTSPVEWHFSRDIRQSI